jgi:ABC-2 type transport system permease protein
VVLRQLTSRSRIIGLTLLALVAPMSGFALGSADASLDDSVRLIASVGLGLVLPIVSLGVRRRRDRRSPRRQDARVPLAATDGPLADRRRRGARRGHAGRPDHHHPDRRRSDPHRAGNGIVGGTLLATMVGLVAYVSVFTLFGVWLKRFIVWGLAYILIWEGFIAQAGAGVARVALRKYTRSILVDRTGADLDLADFSLAMAVIVPIVVAVRALLRWRRGASAPGHRLTVDGRDPCRPNLTPDDATPAADTNSRLDRRCRSSAAGRGARFRHRAGRRSRRPRMVADADPGGDRRGNEHGSVSARWCSTTTCATRCSWRGRRRRSIGSRTDGSSWVSAPVTPPQEYDATGIERSAPATASAASPRASRSSGVCSTVRPSTTTASTADRRRTIDRAEQERLPILVGGNGAMRCSATPARTPTSSGCRASGVRVKTATATRSKWSAAATRRTARSGAGGRRRPVRRRSSSTQWCRSWQITDDRRAALAKVCERVEG